MSTALRVLPSELLYTLAALAVVLVVSFVFGFTNVFGALSAAVSIAISLVVLWLFWRLVTATERIARATESLADDSLAGHED
ncbi:hypothetical protein N0B31_04025 [Salinirubellus salinus]|jgi:hypothetical protein|uniref:Uncharacterized protein n=1 Tax=Salinirubellus salinus TaxID=1364945 RepID=A0A9E7U921_9EURY|nr:hypothetical protein [Salinirubellus salinus]UWM55456.1 hypothetical protein N0B31_04025 [Salinirubellus salinus]